MGIMGSVGIGMAGGALLGMAGGAAVLGTRPPELFGLGLITGVAGATSGLGAGIAGRFTGPVRAAAIGAAAASILPGVLLARGHVAGGDEGVFARIAAGMAGVGIAGGSAALIGRALLRRHP